MYDRYWGKSKSENGDEYVSCHLLAYHSLDVAAAGHTILSRHRSLNRRLSVAVGLSEDVFRRWMTFLLALHDLGKFSESFQGIVPSLFAILRPGKKCRRSYTLRHDSAGYVLWRDLWKKRFAKQGIFGIEADSDDMHVAKDVFEVWMKCVTGHHGEPPRLRLGSRRYEAEDFFGGDDIDAAVAFINDAFAMIVGKRNGVHTFLTDEFGERLEKMSWWLTGLSIVSDWVGSNASVFGYHGIDMNLSKYWEEHALPNAEKALEISGILPSAKAPYTSPGHLFGYLNEPTPLQAFCHETAIAPEPQLWILEDVTGSGKTEAAMILAQRMMTAGLADGVYVGLPTMATANAMYGRMGACYRRLYADGESPSLVLAHGARHLSKEFRRSILPVEKEETGYGPEEPGASSQCATWIADNRKKALLADVGVGTVDQALIGVLPARHQALRLLGLATKFLIVDEVHAYDPYMNKILRELLRFHACSGGSAILLSATLPFETRKNFTDAWLKGLDSRETLNTENRGYPLATRVSGKGISEHIMKTRKSVERTVGVEMVTDGNDVYRLVKEAAERGQCVCWIRNTVDDAVAAYDRLNGELPGGGVMLFHSRFALADRLDIESTVLDCFGPDSDSEKRSGKILIATQVVEQSLDLDFDVMITDLAPIDLVIQRAGRMHRHIRDVFGNVKTEKDAADERPKPVLYVHGPGSVENPEKSWFRAYFPKAETVYPNTGNLWRTARVLNAEKRIVMPEAARSLIESVYGADAEPIPENLEKATCEAEGKAISEKSLARRNALKLEMGYDRDSGEWDEEARTPTRLGEETVTVYLARWNGEQLAPWADGEFPWDLSSVKVYAYKLSGVSDKLPAEMKNEIERLKKTERRFNSGSIILPMVKRDDDTWETSGIDGKGREITIRYDKRYGLFL